MKTRAEKRSGSDHWVCYTKCYCKVHILATCHPLSEQINEKYFLKQSVIYSPSSFWDVSPFFKNRSETEPTNSINTFAFTHYWLSRQLIESIIREHGCSWFLLSYSPSGSASLPGKLHPDRFEPLSLSVPGFAALWVDCSSQGYWMVTQQHPAPEHPTHPSDQNIC